MNRMIFSTVAALGLAFSFTGNASASGEQQDFQQCLSALQAEAADNTASFELKTMRGNSLRRLTFEMTKAGEKEAVVCNIKRGAVVNLDWIVS